MIFKDFFFLIIDYNIIIKYLKYIYRINNNYIFVHKKKKIFNSSYILLFNPGNALRFLIIGILCGDCGTMKLSEEERKVLDVGKGS